MSEQVLVATRGADEVRVGTPLPERSIEVTPTFIVSTALATRDFQDVHHDRDSAIAKGSRDIFLNILTTTGIVERYVTDWAGPQALLRGISIKLGVPCYAYETLRLFGQVLDWEEHRPEHGEEREQEKAAETRFVIEVLGRNGLGDHVAGTVRVVLPEVRA